MQYLSAIKECVCGWSPLGNRRDTFVKDGLNARDCLDPWLAQRIVSGTVTSSVWQPCNTLASAAHDHTGTQCVVTATVTNLCDLTTTTLQMQKLCK
jgi:hypothetical protein